MEIDLKNAFWMALICLVVLSAGLIVMHFAESKSDAGCTGIAKNIGGQCCQDLNHNNVCDALELQAMNEVEEKQKDMELIQLRQEVKTLKSDVEYYKNNYEAELERRWDEDDEFTVKIIVMDEETEEEIEDAYVRLVNEDDEDDYYETEYTDEDGEARFKDVEDDCYELKVRKDGYVSIVKDYCFDEKETERIYLEAE